MSKKVKYAIIIATILVVITIVDIFLAIQYNSVKYDLKDRANTINQEWLEIKDVLDERYSLFEDMKDIVDDYAMYEADSIDNIIEKREDGDITSEGFADRSYRSYMEGIESSCPELKDDNGYRCLRTSLEIRDSEIDKLVEKYEFDVKEYNDLKDSFMGGMVVFFNDGVEDLYSFRLNY